MRRTASQAPMTEVGRRLAIALNESAVYSGNAKALSLACHLGETFVRDVVEGRSKKPRFDGLRAIEEELGLPPGHLTDATGAATDIGTISRSTLRPVPATPRPRPRPDKMPIRSGGRGGNEQEMFLEDVGYTDRPANLEGVYGAYAIYMVGDSMEPRYEQGWLLHINPFKPATPGKAVVVYKTDNAVLIKRLRRRTETELILEQFNPAQEIRIPIEQVR